jgi:hypothetical protein
MKLARSKLLGMYPQRFKNDLTKRPAWDLTAARFEVRKA